MTNTPLAILKLPKPIGEMTDEERHALAKRLFEAMAKAYKPAPPSD